MLEITGNNISELNDGDLRALIGLLCEAELRAVGIPPAGVTWGGDQNAKDGGIDIRVDITSSLHKDSYIPRSETGFQVKKPDMPRAAIFKEMKLDGQLRQAIKDLANSGGAYIIVSSQGSTSDSALTDRKNAMQEALSDYPFAANLKVDFYDRERIAGWVRTHPALTLWVREKIGNPIQGWKSYGNWSRSPGGLNDEYFLDGNIRLHNSAKHRSDGLSAIEGINELRNILHCPGTSVRLVGLSGVGKTRLLQGLFDERIGERPLNPSQVFYSDVSDYPIPEPRNFAERLISLQKPAIIAVDNCPPELHRRLTSVSSAVGSLVSLITVEYDVREDEPEETEVFRLEPASNELIEKLIRQRFDYINDESARLIAEFSGGNARIAIALSNTIRRGENLGRLKDGELFTRLFQQRNEPNNALLKAAEACSIVYSFNCQTAEGSDEEIRMLSSLVGMTVQDIYESISELKRRDLVQQRGKWRAVLPHAIANRLAEKALEDIPYENIFNTFTQSQRMMTSFSRRLGYLHESDKVLEIAREWLSENGLLGNIRNLNDFGINLFINIAPIIPKLTLEVIERMSDQDDSDSFFSRDNDHYIEFTRLLRSLAYDKELFERSVELLCRFALTENPIENNNSIRDLLKSLFYLYLSGTQATPEQRLTIIKRLIDSKINNEIDLGISLLDASLECWQFSSSYSFEFGARSRDYGLSPKSREDIVKWYKLFIEYTVVLAVSKNLSSPKAKTLLAHKFRGLWTEAGMYDELDYAIKEISEQGSWQDGWISVKSTKKFDAKNMAPEVIARLDKLDSMLEPITLYERAKLFALSGHESYLDLVDTVEGQDVEEIDEYTIVEETTRSLGCEAAKNSDIFIKLLPDILSNEGHRLFAFGQGLAEGSDQPREMWQDFKEQLKKIEESKRNYLVLRGFLSSISKINSIISEEFLDAAVTDLVLAKVYPWLQSAVEINIQGIKRLKSAIKLRTASISQYANLSYLRTHESILDSDITELLVLISSEEEGVEVALEILFRRFKSHTKQKDLSSVLISLAQDLLLKYQFLRGRNKNMLTDYKLGFIIKICFANGSAEINARALCKKLIKANENNQIYLKDFQHVIRELANVQPGVFLDEFLGEVFNFSPYIKQLFTKRIRSSPNPLTQIDDELIINWCEINPTTRYPKVASTIVPYVKSEDEDRLVWSTLALKIIANSTDPIPVLNNFKSAFRPMSWSGSRADILQSRLLLVLDLKEHQDPLIASWARQEEKIFKKEISSEREWESKRFHDRDERFE
ncbi:hypothetical protein [Desulfosporosinus shakirovi]|uniref:hypothetical protein n=1 Tax=Desulfosporosinus shakirovi TaxID=2885154 RepID=UPI001E4265B8|nr:hypothetical protein [Desulfosporosinus sp. SRJS8]MCB8818765.1 hypothetical protein [Desulfosporosinus sp. SRJS8]